MTTAHEPPPHAATGTQRLRHLSRVLGLSGTEISHRLRHARCVSCRAELSYAWRYFDGHACCEACEARMGTDERETLRSLGEYL